MVWFYYSVLLWCVFTTVYSCGVFYYSVLLWYVFLRKQDATFPSQIILIIFAAKKGSLHSWLLYYVIEPFNDSITRIRTYVWFNRKRLLLLDDTPTGYESRAYWSLIHKLKLDVRKSLGTIPFSLVRFVVADAPVLLHPRVDLDQHQHNLPQSGDHRRRSVCDLSSLFKETVTRDYHLPRMNYIL